MLNTHALASAAALAFVLAAATANGAITVTGDVTPLPWGSRIPVQIGYTGSGTLTVDAGSEMHNWGTVIGNQAGATGSATISGVGSKWVMSHGILVGGAGEGSLQVQDGGQVSSAGAFIGDSAGSTGTATITGVGSQWTSHVVFVGDYGSGWLHIDAGGRVDMTTGYIGNVLGATSVVTVTGVGSELNSSDELFVRPFGDVSLTVADGGHVTAGTLFASPDDLHGDGTIEAMGAVLDADIHFDAAHGAQPVLDFGSGGTLTVLAAGGDLGAGFNGQGSLTVADGIAVAGSSGYLGHSPGSTGSAIIAGAGSQWNLDDSLNVGYFGVGKLRVEAGGQVSDETGYIGRNSRSTPGTSGVVVTGAGSTWTNSGRLNVGAQGAGTLAITYGGLVSVGSDLIIDFDGDGGSFINMAIGGMLALSGEADDSLAQFLELVSGTDAIRYWDADAGAMALLTAATYGYDYTLEHLATGDLAGYTLLTVTAAGPPGDYNGDFVVDGGDLLAWQRGDSPDPHSAADLAQWQANYGWSAQPAANSAAVPEPAAAALAIFSCLALRLRRG